MVDINVVIITGQMQYPTLIKDSTHIAMQRILNGLILFFIFQVFDKIKHFSGS